MTKVILYDGIVPSETFDLNDVYCISSQGGLPEGENMLAVHLKDRRCYFGDSVSFKMDDF